MKIKNGKVEFLRFIFAMCILFRHINLKVYDLKMTFGAFTLGTLGYMGVEFFFLVSGFLMAKSIRKKLETPSDNNNLGKDTAQFIWKKIKNLLPYHLIVCAIMEVVVCLLAPDRVPWKLIMKLPSVFFFQTTGILGKSSALIAMEWYLSSMFLAMAIIYPLCKKNYSLFTRVIAPLTSVLLIGYLVKTTGCLSGTTDWVGFTMKGNLRALAEIALGTTCYEASRCLGLIKIDNIKFIALRLLEFTCFVLSIIYMFTNLDRIYEVHCLILLAIGTTLAFTEFENLKTRKIFNNKFIYFLGSISLPIYLCQEIVWECVIHWLNFYPLKLQAFIIFLGTLLFALLLYFTVELIKRQKVNHLKNGVEKTYSL